MRQRRGVPGVVSFISETRSHRDRKKKKEKTSGKAVSSGSQPLLKLMNLEGLQGSTHLAGLCFRQSSVQGRVTQDECRAPDVMVIGTVFVALVSPQRFRYHATCCVGGTDCMGSLGCFR